MNDNILNNSINLNPEAFFRGLGYGDKDSVFFRTFSDKRGGEAQNHQVPFPYLRSILPTLHRLNSEEERRGVFYVVNGSGNTDAEVKRGKIARAQFVEMDEGSFPEQLAKLSAFSLEPSFIIKTQKSLHAYWILRNGDINSFRPIQQRLIQQFKGDPTIINESRVLRLYGFNHWKTGEPVPVQLIKWDPELTYTQAELSEVLPALAARAAAPKAAGADLAGERIPQGQGYHEVIRLIGYYLNKLPEAPDSVILSAVEADFFPRYDGQIREPSIEAWRDRYIKDVAKIRAKHETEDRDPAFWGYAVRAWEEERQRTFQKGRDSWEEVRAAGERAQTAGKTFSQASGHADPGREDHTPTKATTEEAKKAPEAPQTATEAPQTPHTVKTSYISDYLNNGQFSRDIAEFAKYKDRKTGFRNIDKYLTLYPGLACLTGATSLGKTSFCVQLADQLTQRGETVIYFTLEQSTFEIASKTIASHYFEAGGRNLTNIDIKDGASDSDLEEVIRREGDRRRLFHVVEWDFSATADQIADYVKDYMQKTGKRPVVMIDYLQLISSPEGARQDDRERVDYAVKKLKRLSVDNDLFILAISNMARASYREKVGEDSYKESGAIEYTCDYLWGLQLAILEGEDFFTTKGSRGGERETIKSAKQDMIDQASQAIPKEVVFKSSKNRNGRKVFKAFFKYYPQYDHFVPDYESPYSEDSKYKGFNRAWPGNLFPSDEDEESEE